MEATWGSLRRLAFFPLFLEAAAIHRIVAKLGREALERNGAFQPGIEGR